MTSKILRIELNEEETTLFLKVKINLGLSADTEVIRYAINYLYRQQHPEVLKS